MNGETMINRDLLIKLLELSDIQWGRYALSRDPLWPRLPEADRTGIAREAQCIGVRQAGEIAERLHSQDPEVLCGAYGITVEEEPELNGCGLYLFARFQEPDRVCLYEKTIQTVEKFACQNLPERFHCPIRQLVLAHELFHVLEFRDRKLPTHSMTVPILRLGRYSWRRKLTAPSEIAAMSFAKALLDTPFYPQALDILLMCAIEQEKAEALMGSILESLGGEGEL